MKPYWQDPERGLVIYHADCREVLPTFADGEFGSVITDPPYAVNIGSRRNNNRDRFAYLSIDDSEVTLREVVLPSILECRRVARRVIVACGRKWMFAYPVPDSVLCIYQPAGIGCNDWGFTCWQPLLAYGPDPYAGSGSRPDSFINTEAAPKIGHPCPKPIRLWHHIVRRCTGAGDSVLDPYAGSCTTGAACAKLGLPCTMIEIEERYCEMGAARLSDDVTYGERNLFNTQEAMA